MPEKRMRVIKKEEPGAVVRISSSSRAAADHATLIDNKYDEVWF